MPSMNAEPFNTHTALTAWQSGPFSIAVAVTLVGLAYWYLRADWRLASRGRRWPGRRTLAFMAGLVAIDLALQSPVATFTGSYFEAHVTQHLLLMVVAPPLLALGAPSTLLLQSRAGGPRRDGWPCCAPGPSPSPPTPCWFGSSTSGPCSPSSSPR